MSLIQTSNYAVNPGIITHKTLVNNGCIKTVNIIFKYNIILIFLYVNLR